MMDKLFTISEPAPSTRIWRDILWMLKDNACEGTIGTVVHCMNINAFSFSQIQSINYFNSVSILNYKDSKNNTP